MNQQNVLSEPLSRRRLLRNGAILSGALLVGGVVATGTATANHPQTLDVDVHPTINPKSKGVIPTTVSRTSTPMPADILTDPNFGGFKLGPRGSTVDANGADAVRWQMKGNGDLKVFFDPKTATIWFDSNDTEATLSAPNVAWGVDTVKVR